MASLLSKKTGEKLLDLIADHEGMPVNSAGFGGEFRAAKDLRYVRLTTQATDDITGDPIPNMWQAEEVRYNTSTNEWVTDSPGFIYYSETAFVIVEDGESGDVVAINAITVVDGSIFWLGIKGGSSPTTLLDNFQVVDAATGEYSADIIDNPTDQNILSIGVPVKVFKATANFDALTGTGERPADATYLEDVPGSTEIPPAKRTVYYINAPTLF